MRPAYRLFGLLRPTVLIFRMLQSQRHGEVEIFKSYIISDLSVSNNIQVPIVSLSVTTLDSSRERSSLTFFKTLDKAIENLKDYLASASSPGSQYTRPKITPAIFRRFQDELDIFRGVRVGPSHLPWAVGNWPSSGTISSTINYIMMS